MSAQINSPPGGSFALLSCRGQSLSIEYRLLSAHNPGPLMVFLHEGLGSLSSWRDFPQRVCDETGCRGLVYSRCGYGNSSPLWPGPVWPQQFMHVEANEILPSLLNALNIDPVQTHPILLGHSDGASIALLYAGAHSDNVSALIVLAPHLFVEPVTQSSIAKTSSNFAHTSLRDKLARHHRHVDQMFSGWSGAWLAPGFSRWDIQAIAQGRRCPTLAIQGLEDEYGTLAQIRSLGNSSGALQLLEIPNCGHAPHAQSPELVTKSIREFLDGQRLAKNADAPPTSPATS